MRTPLAITDKTKKSGTRGRQRISYKPPPLTRLLAGMGMSVATGIALGRLTRWPLSHQVETFDNRLLSATEKTENRVLDPLMAFFSKMGEPQTLYSVSGLLATVWLVKHRPEKSIILALSLVGSAAGNQAIKSVVKRPRPYFKLPLFRSRPSGSSFPSNHASSSLATYGAIALLLANQPRSKQSTPLQAADNQERVADSPEAQNPSSIQSPRPEQSRHRLNKSRKAFLRSRIIRVGLPVLLCALIGWSRVYRGVHNPSDVLGGWIVGGIWLAACAPRRKVVRWRR